MFHNQMLMRNQVDTCNDWELRSDDSCLVETPFFHTGAYNVLCLPVLSLGGQVTITAGFDADHFYSDDKEVAPTVYFGSVPHTEKDITFFISSSLLQEVEIVLKNLSFMFFFPRIMFRIS